MESSQRCPRAKSDTPLASSERPVYRSSQARNAPRDHDDSDSSSDEDVLMQALPVEPEEEGDEPVPSGGLSPDKERKSASATFQGWDERRRSGVQSDEVVAINELIRRRAERSTSGEKRGAVPTPAPTLEVTPTIALGAPASPPSALAALASLAAREKELDVQTPAIAASKPSAQSSAAERGRASAAAKRAIVVARECGGRFLSEEEFRAIQFKMSRLQTENTRLQEQLRTAECELYAIGQTQGGYAAALRETATREPAKKGWESVEEVVDSFSSKLLLKIRAKRQQGAAPPPPATGRPPAAASASAKGTSSIMEHIFASVSAKAASPMGKRSNAATNVVLSEVSA